MHKIKKSIQKLQHYLGRDTQGLGLLGAISEDANGLRKEAAAEKDKVTEAVKLQELVHAAQRVAQQELKELKQQLEQEKATSRQLASDARMWKAAADVAQGELDARTPEDIVLSTPPGEKVLIPLVDPRCFLAAFNTLRREMRVCVKPDKCVRFTSAMASNGKSKDAYVYNMERLISDYSGASMMRLGRFVAVLGMMGTPCLVRLGEELFAEADYTRDDEGLSARDSDEDDTVMAKFIYWFRSNIDLSHGIYDLRLGGPHNLAKPRSGPASNRPGPSESEYDLDLR